ncbi:protein O-mannosyl-transferase family [uncultured Fibrella sp.]|uniref:protein O-mannosyl-transferase family n=1 Tax=uncultured Fibrella sp. TaxID=1284596 RepID=UPI0035C9BC34
MLSYKRLNNLTGWVIFAVALITYASTVERTASFWDCGEFIACAYKLQVPHPPGAPFFLLLGRLFSFLAGGDVTKVAYWINMVSVLSSAATILFLFWTITMLVQKTLTTDEEDYTTADTLLVIGSGAVGALVYTFSDTFWFSAVEAEVYGLSSFFTAIVVWAALRWERIKDEATANRWILLIAYLTGLSIGVHLLNLVTLPALALLFYYKHYNRLSPRDLIATLLLGVMLMLGLILLESVIWRSIYMAVLVGAFIMAMRTLPATKYTQPTTWGVVLAFCIGMAFLGVINAGVIPGLPSSAFAVERFAVNTLGLPFNVGVITFVVIFFSALIYLIIWSARKRNVALHTGLLAFAFVLIGYASFIQVLVRSNYNTPINENDPSDALNFISYLKREQYGSRSLTYGPIFTAEPSGQESDKSKLEPVYMKNKTGYEIFDYKPVYTYEKGDQMLFPRVWSNQQNHPQLYRRWLHLAEGQKPTFGDNINFFITYQLGHMWARYLMWNFAGRESDIEGAGYLTPFSSNSGLPEVLQNNKGRDNFYMLPLVLALLGIVYQAFRRRGDFLVVMLLFLFTGIALQVFLNSPPSEPRERDYIYVGSFYFFAIWVGLGVTSIAEGLNTFIKNATLRNALVPAVFLLVPVMMGAKSWDNHDRSNRYHSVDFAKNLLNSCAPNAILFTGGDNDTFPLWYAQEVEGIRRDVRVCNLSLLGTEWYIQQMKRDTYESKALPISLDMEQFNKGKNDIVLYYANPSVKSGIDLRQYISLIKQNSPAIQVPLTTGEMANTLPSSTLFLPIDKAAVDKAGFVPAELRPYMKDTLQWNIGERNLYKPDLIILDMIAANNWQRPIYFSATLGGESYLNLRDHMQLEGYAYRLMPVAIPGVQDGYVNSDVMYKNMMNRMAWREMNNPNTYYDETYKGSPVVSARIAFFRLADQLLREGKKEQAKAVLQRSLSVLPDKSIPYDQVSASYVRLLLEIGDTKQATDIADTMSRRADQNLTYYEKTGRTVGETNADLYGLQMLSEAYKEAKQPQLSKKYEDLLQKHFAIIGN